MPRDRDRRRDGHLPLVPFRGHMNDESKSPSWKPVDPMRRFQDAGKKRRVRTDSGKARIVPALPFEYWLKPAGNKVKLVVMTTRNTEQAVNPSFYANYARSGARRDGWIPWEWADAQAYCPAAVVASKCTSKAEWDVYREEELKRRRSAHEEQSRRMSAVWLEQAGQRKLETQEAFTEAFKKFGEKAAEIAGSQASSPAAERKPRGNG
jgi:hypothetical protein